MVSSRIQPMNRQVVAKGKYVLYILRSMRSKDSPALSFASQQANDSKVPVLAVYFYIPGTGGTEGKLETTQDKIDVFQDCETF
ncbi:hypothetical protein AB6A40_008044 [Gnathostoma spinigerum]|uniref:Photolyase/cryptochrome alpha/beta domain-containing protein n=1 Tax=Gnathostoma spinigerum TaxID=75299 RepID=A0ABD6EMY6_9BILA